MFVWKGVKFPHSAFKMWETYNRRQCSLNEKTEKGEWKGTGKVSLGGDATFMHITVIIRNFLEKNQKISLASSCLDFE